MRTKYLSTTAKREGVAARLASIAESLGATTKRDSMMSSRRIVLRLHHGDYWVMISLDGDSRCEGFLGHWNTEHGARYPKNFGFTVHGSVNEYHYGKATTCVDTPEQFYAAIEAGLVRCVELTREFEAISR